MTKPTQPKPINVRPGDIVYWYNFGDTNNPPLPAIVIFVRGQNSLCLQVFDQNGMTVKDGVKHRNDDSITPMHRERAGCWGLRDK